MAHKPALRAVTAADVELKPKKLTVEQAAESGDHRALLVALRDEVAKTISAGCPPRDMAALTRRLQDIAAEIRAIDARAKQEASEDAVEVEDGDFDEDAV
jgi:hypothetical protein